MSTQQQQSRPAQTQTRELDFDGLVDRWASASMTQKYNALDKSLQARVEKVRELLPNALKAQAERLVKRAMLTFARNAKLQKCTPESFVRCVLEAAELGLAIDGQLGHAVPYNVKIKTPGEKDRWEDQAQFQPDYKGLVAVAKRVGLIKDCYGDVVCDGDEFRASRSLDGDKLFHERDLTRRRGDVMGAYMIFVLPDAPRRYELLDLQEIHQIRASSKSWNREYNGKHSPSGPWVDWFNAMAKKSVVKRGLKMFKEDPAMARAFELDDRDYEIEDDEEPESQVPDRPPVGRHSLKNNGTPRPEQPPESSNPPEVGESEEPQQDAGGAKDSAVKDAGSGDKPKQDAEAPQSESAGTMTEEQMQLSDELREYSDRIEMAATEAAVDGVYSDIMKANLDKKHMGRFTSEAAERKRKLREATKQPAKAAAGPTQKRVWN